MGVAMPASLLSSRVYLGTPPEQPEKALFHPTTPGQSRPTPHPPSVTRVADTGETERIHGNRTPSTLPCSSQGEHEGGFSLRFPRC